MRLAQTLRIEPGQVIAFVGAGGKSTAIKRLAEELARQIPVLVTTTTKLSSAQENLAQAHLIVRNKGDLLRFPASLASARSLLVTGGPEPKESKLLGLQEDLLESACRMALEAGACVLIEADGAQGRSLKAPAPHEPQIPSFSDMVVLVAGLDVLGRPLTEEHVHRPERLSALVGLPEGEKIEVHHLTSALLSAQGGMKSIPAGALVRVLLNKAEDDAKMELGRQTARDLLRSGRVRSVLLGQVSANPPVTEAHGRVAGVILAGGSSERMPGLKQTIGWRGHPLVWYAIKAALDAGLDPVVVVLGFEEHAVREAVANEPVTFVSNTEWQAGQSTSLKAGLAAVEDQTDATIFLLSDMPWVSEEHIRALLNEHRRTLSAIVAPRAKGRWGNPVLFDRDTYPALHAISGDRGGKQLFDKFLVQAVDWDPEIFFDVDTLEDLKELRGLE